MLAVRHRGVLLGPHTAGGGAGIAGGEGDNDHDGGGGGH